MQKDRRNNEKIIYYQPAPQSDEQAGGGDLQQILSFILGFVGIMFKQKLCLWGALFMLLSCFANIKQSTDVKQLIINSGLVVMGMVSLYYWGPRQELAMQQKFASDAAEAAVNQEAIFDEKLDQ